MDNQQTKSEQPPSEEKAAGNAYTATDGSKSWWDSRCPETNGKMLMIVIQLFISGLAIGISCTTMALTRF